jgi:hypothetical protein
MINRVLLGEFLAKLRVALCLIRRNVAFAVQLKKE